MPQFDFSLYPSQIFWLLCCCLFLFIYVRFVFVSRMNQIFKKRQNKVQEDYQQSCLLKEQAQIQMDCYNEAIAQAKEQAVEQKNRQISSFEFMRQQKLEKLKSEFFVKCEDLEKMVLFETLETQKFQDILLKNKG